MKKKHGVHKSSDCARSRRGMSEQGEYAVGQKVGGGLMPGQPEHHDHGDHLGVADGAVAVLPLDQSGDQVVRGLGATSVEELTTVKSVWTAVR